MIGTAFRQAEFGRLRVHEGVKRAVKELRMELEREYDDPYDPRYAAYYDAAREELTKVEHLIEAK